VDNLGIGEHRFHWSCLRGHKYFDIRFEAIIFKKVFMRSTMGFPQF
jgi:hypothetical protein